MKLNKQNHTLKIKMSDEELEQAMYEIIGSDFGNTCNVFDDGEIGLDVTISPKQIVAIAELLKKEGRV